MSSFLLFSSLLRSLKLHMWYFSDKQSWHLLEMLLKPELVSIIFHLILKGVFVRLSCHTYFESSVFVSCSGFLNEDVWLLYLSLKRVHSPMYTIGFFPSLLLLLFFLLVVVLFPLFLLLVL